MAMAAYSGPDCDLQPAPAVIQEFLSWWFEKCTRGKVEIGWVDKDGKGLNHFLRFDLGDPELVIAAVEQNLVPGQSLYFRAATVTDRPFSAFTHDQDFVQAPGPWGDIDTPEQMAQAKSVQTMVRPNGSVITGNIPHTRVQTFFRASEPIVAREQVRSLNRRVHRLYGGDSSVVNPTRLMRLPGTIAWPWKPGRVPELTTFTKGGPERQAFYPLSLLTSQLPAEEAPEPTPQPAAKDQPASFGSLSTVGSLIRAIQSGDHWHNNMIRLTAHWIGRGMSNAEIMLACEGLTLPGYTAQQTRDEVRKAIDGGRTKWGVADQEHIVTAEPDKPFPDQVIDPWDALQAPEFPIHALPADLRAFVETRSRVIGADPCALAWTCLSAASAALNGRIRLRMKKHDRWSVPAPLWVALIGRSSTKKTPIIDEAWRPLIEAQQRVLAAHHAAMQQWKALPKEEQKGNEPPRPLRLLSHDATMESVQDILSCQDRGLGILRDELAGFIGSMDKYSSGRGGAADRAFWLQAFNGGAHVVDRVGRGTTPINNLLVTICGGIQPDRLATFSDLADDGLWQRFIPIIVKPGEMGTDEAPSEIAEHYTAVVEGILGRTGDQIASLSDAAHEVRADLEKWVFDLERQEPLGARFASFTGKLTGLFGRLCLVLSYLEPSGMGFIVSERAAKSAATLIKHCVVPHASRVYQTMGGDGTGQDATQAIAGYILSKKIDRLVASDLSRNVRQCRMHGTAEVAQLVSPLVSGGWLEPELDKPGNKSWLVNPSVHTLFANRAQIETRRRTAARALLTGETDNE